MPDARKIAVPGAPVEAGAGGGMRREVLLIVKRISEPDPLSSIDLAEPTPLRDACGKAAALPTDPSASRMGKTIIDLTA